MIPRAAWIFVIALGLPAALFLLLNPRIGGSVAFGTGPEPGTRLEYRLTYRTAGEARTAGLQNPAANTPQLTTRLETSLEANVTETFAAASGPARAAAFVFEVRSLSVTSDGQAVETAAARAALDGMKLTAWVDARNRITRVAFSPDRSDPIARNLAKAALAALALPVPERGAPVRRWKEAGFDLNGEYRADFTVESVSERVARIRKTKREYAIDPAQAARSPVLPAVRKSSEDFVVRVESRVVESADEAETIETLVAGKPIARTESRIQWTLKRDSAAAPGEALPAPALAAGASPESLLATRDDAALERRTRIQQLGADSARTLLPRLRALTRESGNETETTLFLKLRALLILEPGAAQGLGREARTFDAGSKPFLLSVEVLANAGTPESQAALRELIRSRPDDRPALVTLVSALATVTNPTLESRDLLQSLAQSAPDSYIRAHADYGLGSMARRLQESDPDAAASIVASAIQGLESAGDDRRKSYFLAILGNAGSDASLPRVEGALSEGSESVRAEAATALRFVAGPRAEELLVSSLKSDSSELVRGRAAVALGQRPVSAAIVAAESEAYRREASANVRIELLRNLSSAAPAFPSAGELVKEAAERDPSADVRRSARMLVPPA